MSNKMLIDASHPEETRVAVVRGNRIEEYDFESQEKKQLRGNIYLAKVTRVEPSLQAAFVDYGGNRHGFLAFSEIHPDYYQIPVADRQALLEAEAAEARAMREAEEAEDEELLATSDDDDDEELVEEEQEEKPKPRQRRRSRKAKKADQENENEAEGSEAKDAEAEEDGKVEDAKPVEAKENADTTGDEAPEEEKPAPKRRATRRTSRKKKEEEAVAESSSGDEADNGNDDDEGSSGTMAAIVEMDSISEPLPEDDDRDGSDGSDETLTEAAEEKPAPKRRSRARKKPEPKAEAEAEEVSEKAEDVSDADAESKETEEAASEKPKKRAPRRRSPRKKVAAEVEAAEEETSEATEDDKAAESEEEEAPKAKKRRRRSKESKDDTDDGDVDVVGQEDALEELPSPKRTRRQYKIQEVIKRRQVLLIQVVKEERGNKGAALTTYLSLAGRYSVLMPNTARGGGISRKITSSGDRKRLKAIASELAVPDGMGVILRTAGASRTKDEIERDFQYLMRLWEQVRNLTLASTAPCLVYEEGSLIKRSIRDLYSKDTGEVLVSGEAGFEEARSFMDMLMPEHVGKVQQYSGAQAIFGKYGVESQLENMVSPQVTLKSGGYLVINQTEALVAVDVNSGRATREHSVEKTALQTNLEAAEEVARQLRLRDLAGLIVIDFIDMEERRNNRAVEKKLKDCLKHDRARIQVGRISHFGLLEMSRQRMRASVLESTMNGCPHCAGTGYIRSESAIALHVFRALEEHVERNRNRDAIVRTTPDIAAHVLNHKRAALVELENKFGIQILIIADAQIIGQEFRIEKGDKSSSKENNGAVGFDGDHQGDGDSEGDDNRSKRKRGRRRRNQDADNPDGSSANADSQDAGDDTDGEDEDGKPRKRRRRGRRGGRKQRDDAPEINSEETDTPADENTSTVAETPASSAPEPAVAEAMDTTPSAEVEEEKPRRRSTTRRKAPISKPVEQEAVASESTQMETTPPPPRPKRRTTRRKSEDEVANASEEAPAAVEDQAPSPAAETATPQASSAEATASEGGGDEAEGKEKRRGWWNRGSGFF